MVWTLFLDPMGPHWPQDGLYGVPTVTWRHNHNFHFFFFNHGNFLRFWPIFFTQWDPTGPKMGPMGSPPWFGAITVTSIFWEKSMTAGRGTRKFEFWGMVIFYGFDPFFLPNGTPSQDGLYGVPTVMWHHNRNFHFLQKIDDRHVIENSNFGAW